MIAQKSRTDPFVGRNAVARVRNRVLEWANKLAATVRKDKMTANETKCLATVASVGHMGNVSYYESVGRGANLILNLPPDRRGIIHENDVASLRGMRRILDRTFAKNFARDAKLVASNVRGADKAFAPAKLVDGKNTTYWSTDDGVTTPELTLEWKIPVTFDVFKITENIQLGQRVEMFALDQWKDGAWQEFVKATSIGAERLLRFEPITTNKLRVRITQSPACPALGEIGVFKQP
jgi:alpha-L-fucosidase